MPRSRRPVADARGSGRWRPVTTRRLRARCGSTRWRTGSWRSRGRPRGRRPRASGASCRRRRRSAPCTPSPACAPSATSRCSSCPPRSGGRRWRSPSGTRPGTVGVGMVRDLPAGEVTRGCPPMSAGRRRRSSSRCSTSKRSRSTSSAACSPDVERAAGLRRPGRRPGAGGGGAHGGARRSGSSTRCTPTSCGPATRRCRSSTRSTASATAARSPPGASWPSSTAGPSSTCGVVPHPRGRAFDHQFPMPEVPPARRPARTSPTRWAPFTDRLGDWYYGRPRPIDTRYVDWNASGPPGAAAAPPAGLAAGRRRPARRPGAPRLRAHLRLRHDPARHHPAAPRRHLHGRQGP